MASKPRKARKQTAAQKRAKEKAAAATPTPEEVLAAPVDVEAPEPAAKGELRDAITHFGRYYPAGTKASDVKPALSGDDKDRLEALGVLA